MSTATLLEEQVTAAPQITKYFNPSFSLDELTIDITTVETPIFAELAAEIGDPFYYSPAFIDLERITPLELAARLEKLHAKRL